MRHQSPRYKKGGHNRGGLKGKAFKRFCHSQAKRGLINTSEGNWVPLPSGDTLMGQSCSGMIASYYSELRG